MKRQLTAEGGAANERLDVYLAEKFNLTRARIQHLLKDGAVKVNGSAQRASYRVQPDDIVEAEFPVHTETIPVPPTLPVLYEDPDLLVVDKPAGLIMHPGSGTAGAGTVADFAREHSTDPDATRPGIVHRLDRDTSGLVIIAKSAAAKTYLQKQFRERQVHKTYQVLLVGRIKPSAAEIRLPLGRHPSRGLRQAVVATGRQAVTRYEILAAYPGYSHVLASPETGRTHQLRVHFAALGHPVAGDTAYGQPHRQLGLTRQFLHAGQIEFTTPAGKKLKLQSPLPTDLEKALHALAKNV
jgi:23S rRNA pseudouridine1911/1915/1917 synthase